MGWVERTNSTKDGKRRKTDEGRQKQSDDSLPHRKTSPPPSPLALLWKLYTMDDKLQKIQKYTRHSSFWHDILNISAWQHKFIIENIHFLASYCEKKPLILANIDSRVMKAYSQFCGKMRIIWHIFGPVFTSSSLVPSFSSYHSSCL